MAIAPRSSKPSASAQPTPARGSGPLSSSARRSSPGGASLIPDAFLDQLKDRASVVDVVGRRVQLRKAGTGMVGLCPFHKERTPSFTVSSVRNTYHCFGCGAHGNALGFLIEYEGLTFRQAVRDLAGEVGLTLPPEMQAGGAHAVETLPLYAAMELARKFFAHCLRETPRAREYLKSRGLSPGIVKRYAIGFAPDEWRGLKEAFSDYERNEHIAGAGLVRDRESESAEEGASPRRNRYDTFRNRVTFAVRDSRGRTVAFGGRLLPESDKSPGATSDAPKYMNSPESPIFDKSGSLFGLFEARDAIRARREALVVEGYFDVVMLAQQGVDNAVAAMGTAFTRWHLERLLTQTSRIVFCLDGDEAGRKAAFKTLQTCAPMLDDEHDLRFVTLPEGMDPDEFVQQRGAQALRDLVAEAPGFTEFLITTVQASHGIEPGLADAASAEARARFAAQAQEIARRVPYATRIRALMMEQIAAEARLPGSAIAAVRTSAAVRFASNQGQGLWELLSASVREAPDIALQCSAEILDVLDPSDDQEASLAHQLRSLNMSEAQPPPTSLDSPRYLLARDSLRAALDLIVAHRDRQVRAELDRQLAAGEITDVEYLRAKHELASRL